ncbi:TPA: PfkB family carbohydrate kinase [Pasteurella multocida]|uniref:PfkB family carbohydrate kinase n=1 Tax=Pasteurella multocida TaxID=747 RepID=UPI0032FA8C19|nr:nucleoside 2-deoxyribosyltransferase [Pasteurella multocida]HDR1432931.1 nucleoside 2-deoxyribosyltransferase [Pasteurella multocida]HDR1791952.1 nucleoside 2-deoxyribosyltransferase [Pasteurella multocida]HDR1830066.1 nucleoside 2-deoxyribosyltransferase [Pasteurella multocida]HDR1857134.1 nucleoside 2-deoxyribosyltransferase [Pasteurella multocida]
MSSNKHITVIGGVYYEQCIWPSINELYGSAGRALSALQALNCETKLYSCLNQNSAEVLKGRARAYSARFEICSSLEESYEQPKFSYFHGLSTPYISKIIEKNLTPNKIQDNNILVFGMLESNPIVSGNKVVYDPQNPVSPRKFYENGSTAQELAIVLNISEAYKLVKKENLSISEIIDILLHEGASIVVLKRGPLGISVFQKEDDKKIIENKIPCYLTENVYKIGSGDYFSACFAYQWMVQEQDPVQAAELASKATAYYCETAGYPSLENLDEWNERVQPIQYRSSDKKPKVYLAGPFFTLNQIWLINETRSQLTEMGFDVFSPYHEIGIGDAETVVPKDIEGINNSDIIFAIVDGLDAGTIFEIGYAKAKDKPVVIYSENEKLDDLKMMYGTGCIISKDYVSSLYRALWESLK